MSGPLLASEEIPTCPTWLMAWAGILPLAYYVASASGHATWYQDAALVGSASELGVGPAPGAPLSSLISALLTLLPVGPLSFRVACASAALLALSLSLFARALFHTLHGLGARHAPTSAALSLAAAWSVGLCPGFWYTASHASVYALSWLFTLVIIDALVRFELSEPSDDSRLLHFVAFMQGLSFANHYVLAMLTLPAVAPTLGRVFARRGFIGLMGHAVAPIFGFSAYVYVPIRAAQHPSINFGEAHTLSRLLSFLSAEPFWGPERLAFTDGVLAVMRALSWSFGSAFLPLCALTLLGCVLARRARGRRRFAVLWALLALVPLSAMALLIRPALHSDRVGALVPTQLGMVALAALGLTLALESSAKLRAGPHALRAARALLGLLALGYVLCGSERGLARFDTSDALADLARRALPERALVLAYDPDTQLRHLAGEVEEHVRPDVTVVPLSAVGDPGDLAALLQRHPELGPVLRDVVVRGELALGSVQSLALSRPLLLALDAHVPPELYPTLVSEGLLSRALSDGATPGDERVAASALSPRLRQLSARLKLAPLEPDVESRLAATLYYQALQAAAFGDMASAHSLLALAADVAPSDARGQALRAALREGKPVDARRLGGF